MSSRFALWSLVGALLAVAPARAHAQAPPSPEQRLAIYAKPSVVRVQSVYIATYSFNGHKLEEAIGGSGTGWFITPDGYIATNAHVVADVQAGDDVAKKALFSRVVAELDREAHTELMRLTERQRQEIYDGIKLVDLKKWEFVVLPNGDHLDYEVKAFGKPGTGKDAAIIKVKLDNAPTLPIGDSASSQVEDRIIVIGYPGVADAKDLLDEKSQLEASVTDGAVSSIKRSAGGDPILQISAPITHGNSGGPAIDGAGQVVGLATFGSDVQGFNFLVASATLTELVKGLKITNAPSDTNRAWREGLDLYWDQEYSAAITKFEEVQALFPAHSEALNFIKASNQAKKAGKEKKPASHTGVVAGVIIGIVMLALIAAILVVRRRKPAVAVGATAQVPVLAGGPAPGYPQGLQMIGGAVQPRSAMPAGAVPFAAPREHAPVPKTAFGAFSIGNLTCTRGLLAGQRFALTAQGVLIGRQPGVAQIVINDHRASAKHVWIGIDQGRVVCIDQGTTNGTYVNDVTRGRISRVELHNGDIVIIAEPDVLSLQFTMG